MKIKVTTEHGCGWVYMGMEVPEDEWEGVEKLMVKAAEGKLNYLSFISDFGGRVYIPAKVLETSIVEIIE